MKRLTWKNFDMCQSCGEGTCCEHYCDNTFPVCDDKAIYDRLAAIEDILGDEYDLDELKEVVQAKREGRCVILQKEEPLKRGMTIWYVDTDTGEIEEGEVFSTDYKDGRLDRFSVDFKFSGDFDEFLGSAWGSCFFGSRERAQAALRREQDENR